MVTRFTGHLYTHASWLHFTDHWHTHTSVLSLLKSPLSVSWQRILTQELQRSRWITHSRYHTKSSLHSRTLATNWLPQIVPVITSWNGPRRKHRSIVVEACADQRKHRFQQLLCCCVLIRYRGNLSVWGSYLLTVWLCVLLSKRKVRSMQCNMMLQYNNINLVTGLHATILYYILLSCGSSVGITRIYRFHDRGQISGREFRPALGPTQPPIQWILGALPPEVKRSGSESNHSPPPTVKVKNYGAIPPWRNA
jgi:hypothetical protein